MNKFTLLKNCATYVTEKISGNLLTKDNYIGVDNILPNRGGIRTSEYFSGKGKVTSFKKGDILIGNIRPYFKKIWLATFDGGCDADVLCIRPNANVSSEFLYAALSTDSFFNYVVRGAKGSKMPRGDKKQIMEFPIMDIHNKTTIGNFIVRLNSAIAINNKISKELESMAKTIYDYWFLQFEFPNEDGKPYKSSGGKMVWNDQLKQEIPEGWEVQSLKNNYLIDRGISYSSKDLVNKSSNPMINLGSIDKNRRYKPEALKYLSYKKEYKYLKPMDMLIACTDLTRNADIIGSPILVPDDGNKYTYSMDLAKINSNNPKITNLYLYQYLRNDFYHKYIKKWASGTNVIHLNLKGLDWLNIVIPPEKIQNKYNQFLKDVYQKNSIRLQENQQLKSLRDFLLPMLMNGQVTIKN